MNDPCHEIQLMLSRFLDGTLNKRDKVKVVNHLRHCSVCQKLSEIENEIILLLSTLPEHSCPESVAQRIERETGSAVKNSPSRVKKHSLFNFLHWRPLYIGVALTMILCLVIWRPFMLKKQIIQTPISQEEAIKVKKQAKWSLAYIAGVIQNAQKEVVEDVLIKELPKTFRKSLRHTFPIMKGGKK